MKPSKRGSDPPTHPLGAPCRARGRNRQRGQLPPRSPTSGPARGPAHRACAPWPRPTRAPRAYPGLGAFGDRARCACALRSGPSRPGRDSVGLEGLSRSWFWVGRSGAWGARHTTGRRSRDQPPGPRPEGSPRMLRAAPGPDSISQRPLRPVRCPPERRGPFVSPPVRPRARPRPGPRGARLPAADGAEGGADPRGGGGEDAGAGGAPRQACGAGAGVRGGL